ncbi:hypothetical protein DACRYDRAFT_105385 [Dacryopinax primogenitus]|uniref:CID domain-containing protein n=1 Tax=Dacryopinax primogenitus (strain DJM 731) TaxID=1858805 RepID=M5GFQ4_DACPD|nr:uncharacterized protein DACRYDRAFT_105385 [Dacryopinax primogenitus]EJU04323.1 hypothetical protein DACRYDRAFT_105385 [Dacryopinax primogenitus]
MSALRKPNLAMFNTSDDDEAAPPPQSKSKVDDAKIQHFTSGSVRKSKKDKEKEAAEAKAREEEERAKAAYAEFLDDFASGPVDKREGKGFVRAGQSGSAPPNARGRGPVKANMAWDEEKPEESAPAMGGARHYTKGRRAMDSFLEEIKRDQASREERLKRSGQAQSSSFTSSESRRGSRDVGDMETTNVFVANLPTGVTEQGLGTYFAKCGPVGSVKIMWPRHEDPPSVLGVPTGPRRQNSLSGFVCFMKRRDAEVAVSDLDGAEWNGSTLRVGWSKAVSVPSRAMFDLGPGIGAKRGRSRSPERQHHKSHTSRSKSRSPRRYDSGRDRDRGRERDRGRDKDWSPDRRRRDSRSRSPPRKRYRDDSRTPERSRERRRRSRSPEEYKRERTLELEQFDDDGANSIYSTDSAEESENENHRKGTLGKLALRRFESMLRGTTGKRGEIARLMSFALNHADAATEIARIILSSLLVDSTPVPRKVARLHVICDILHNSAASVPNAWKLRQEFESGLGQVFDHMETIHDSFPGRITAETFKKQITNVLDVWEDWIVFPPEKTQEYRRRLDGNVVQEVAEEEETVQEEVREEVQEKPRFKASSFRPAGEAEDVDGQVMEDVDGAPIEDVDGVPMDDVDGAPMDDVDGAPMDDVDGAPMDDVDGAPLEDVDGAPLEYVDEAPLDDVDGAPLEDVDGAPLEVDATHISPAVVIPPTSGPVAVDADEEEDMAIEDD